MKPTKTGSVQRIALIVSGALTAGICLVMNLYLIPAIEKNAGGLRVFDMRSFGYTQEEGRAFLAALTEEGTRLYLTRQLPLDLLYPVAYTLFFVLLLGLLLKKHKELRFFPLLLTAADLTENVCLFRLLGQGTGSDALLTVASTATVVKTVLMTAVFVLILVLLVLRLWKRKKQKDLAKKENV